MKIRTIIVLWASVILLTAGCSGKSDSAGSAKPLPWIRVEEVEVTSDTEAQEPSLQVAPNAGGAIGAGSSQSQVITAWGTPDYIHDSAEDPDRKIWQYSHALVVFQGTRVQTILPRR